MVKPTIIPKIAITNVTHPTAAFPAIPATKPAKMAIITKVMNAHSPNLSIIPTYADLIMIISHLRINVYFYIRVPRSES